jgi:hypothetical protein
MKAHAVIKQLQKEGDIFCETQSLDLGGVIGLIHYQVPRSLNFFDTDETEAQQVWSDLCDYVAKRFFPDWDSATVEAAAEHWKEQT